ncbi:unnamed protein product, partial [Symbiodinium sp. KB8]
MAWQAPAFRSKARVICDNLYQQLDEEHLLKTGSASLDKIEGEDVTLMSSDNINVAGAKEDLGDVDNQKTRETWDEDDCDYKENEEGEPWVDEDQEYEEEEPWVEENQECREEEEWLEEDEDEDEPEKVNDEWEQDETAAKDEEEQWAEDQPGELDEAEEQWAEDEPGSSHDKKWEKEKEWLEDETQGYEEMKGEGETGPKDEKKQGHQDELNDDDWWEQELADFPEDGWPDDAYESEVWGDDPDEGPKDTKVKGAETQEALADAKDTRKEAKGEAALVDPEDALKEAKGQEALADLEDFEEVLPEDRIPAVEAKGKAKAEAKSKAKAKKAPKAKAQAKAKAAAKTKEGPNKPKKDTAYNIARKEFFAKLEESFGPGILKAKDKQLRWMESMERSDVLAMLGYDQN